ncbi:MAG: lytic transglycosylase domain-containing protein [Oceanibaculum nanhaiense]|uniref:lytic transglycosylase domain-containing protein n=1 Tax=Oceanibaculum nanhaiense TaxID=1909734 RepID=UPI0025A4ADBD|nr:lytic transglycosylase domain-containing protein [Oceanibaculum nanhaiense]MDM7946260.1 lytic transglycosylase domain-containing protein [Oceanibaculum nanhaiense]
MPIRLTIPVLCLLALASGLVASGPASAASALKPAQKDIYTRVFAAAQADKWTEARATAASGKDALLDKALHWMDLTRPDTDATFAEITAFLHAHPDWPHRNTLRLRGEQKMPETLPATAVSLWFAEFPPLTQDGRLRQLAALKASGHTEKLTGLARTVWRRSVFGRSAETEFLKDYAGLLRAQDHASRLDWLLWEGHLTSAERMLPLVPADLRALAVARMRLRDLRPGVDAAINAVPKALQDDPALLYERIRWRRMKGRTDEARELLAQAPADPDNAGYWWRERAYHFREALNAGHISDAYRLASRHGAKSGIVFAEGEFLAGWTALRFLEDKKDALTHFTRMHDGVSTPISRGRAAYWAGRAAEALNRREEAARWYGEASAHITTFYGQLAAARLEGPLPALPADPIPDAAEIAAFEKLELVRLVRRLSEIDQPKLLSTFLDAVARQADSAGQRQLVADLGQANDNPDVGVRLARQFAQDGLQLIEAGYPVPGRIAEGHPKQTLILSLIRQESNFDSQAISRAGARGLMQLMPATARQVARQENLTYAPAKLTEDPDFNVALGSRYMVDLLDNYDGFYPAAIAAYNAGPSRASRWLREIGDPRRGDIDIVDWIELIPFSETRNYVQRVLENLYVYRTRLQLHPTDTTKERTLHVWCVIACGVRLDNLQRDAALLPHPTLHNSLAADFERAPE